MFWKDSNTRAYEYGREGSSPFFKGYTDLAEILSHHRGEMDAADEAKARKDASSGIDSGSGGGFVGGLISLVIVVIILGAIFGGTGKTSTNRSATVSASTASNGTPGSNAGEVRFASGTNISAVFYPETNKLAVAVKGRYLPLYGIEALAPASKDFRRSAAFAEFDKRISTEAGLDCQQMADATYKCFLVVSGDGQVRRYDIAKYAINWGAATATADAPADYIALANEARASGTGNWAGAVQARR